MNKTDLIDAIASAAELNKKQAKAALEATLAAITGSPVSYTHLTLPTNSLV